MAKNPRMTRRLPALLVAACALASGGGGRGALSVAGEADPLEGSQWALAKIGAPAAWQGSTGAGVTIAVVDTGVDLDHEDLVGKVDVHISCVGADDDPSRCAGLGGDDAGHGTHVAGIAAAATRNGTGMAGVAPDARIMSVKVLSSDGSGSSGSSADVRAGIRWAVDHGANVVNLSLGGDIAVLNLLSSPLADAINEAWAAGVIPVVAAGNDALFPTGYHGVDALVVTATDKNDNQASYASNVTGADWAIAAPGGDGDADAGQIVSAWWDPNRSDVYRYLSGTSMAAPHVSAAAALLLAKGLAPQQVVDRLLSTSVDLGAPGYDPVFGAGRLDVAAAVGGPSAPPPVPTTLPDVPVAPATAAEGTSQVLGSGASRPAGGVRVALPPVSGAPSSPDASAAPFDPMTGAPPPAAEAASGRGDSESGGGSSLALPGVAALALLGGVGRAWWLRRPAPST